MRNIAEIVSYYNANWKQALDDGALLATTPNVKNGPMTVFGESAEISKRPEGVAF